MVVEEGVGGGVGVAIDGEMVDEGLGGGSAGRRTCGGHMQRTTGGPLDPMAQVPTHFGDWVRQRRGEHVRVAT